MRLSTLPIAVAALSLAGQSAASSCTQNLIYCGKTLFGMGWTWSEVLNRVTNSWETQHSYDGIKNEGFRCVSGDKLEYVTTCWNGCVDGGYGQNDWCR